MPALALTILVSIIVLPPLFSINRYKSRIAGAISSSLGRPVHLSGVELRVLPRPGFVITDLTVQEDPAFGAEPVLHANEVKAAIRLFSLWRGQLEISRISVDEASLNLVRNGDGRWNMDSLFRTAAQTHPNGSSARKQSLPYLEATNSRINIKKGIEKLPYSLLNADLSFWEENPGDWRVRLKGQPARTDVSLELGDTGLVQLEASMRRAPELKLMPIHMEMEWRQAQLGQLSRLIIGSDPGWRGDLTAEMKLDGTAESAQMTTRLRASGVHRAEFAPAEPLDFDANCSMVYHYSARTIEKLACSSPLGNGRLLIEGNLPSNGQPNLSVQVDKIPAQAILDALRTVRSEVGAGLEAAGSLSGRLEFDAAAPTSPVPSLQPTKASHHLKVPVKPEVPKPGLLTGSITIDSLRLSGGSLTQPIQIQKAVLQPASSDDGNGVLLAGSSAIPAGAPTPLAVSVRLTQASYQVSIKGAGTPARLGQIAQAAGLKEAGALDAITGDPVTLDLAIAGPWLPASEILLAESVGASAIPVTGGPTILAHPIPDRLTGTVTLHNANWKTDALATAIQIPQAVLHLSGGTRTWDPVDFVYGPVKGTARVVVPVCPPDQECAPAISLEFDTVDAADLQSALLGSEKKGTLLSSVISKITSSSSDHQWPAFQGQLKARSLLLGPVTLENATADLKIAAAGAELTSLDAELLGGQIHATGKVENGDKPAYTLEGQAEGIEPAEFCRLLELKCGGRPIDGAGKVQLTGFTASELGNSAKGTVHFDWTKGSVTGSSSEAEDAPPATLARFSSWTVDADIANNSATIGDNTLKNGAHASAIKASVTFGIPPRVVFGSQKPDTAKK
ncbi:MAG: AsmA family protein [Acidobacteria bacterium]|nr:AsmA family protein [Acidobacteriota bacterium]